MRSLQRIVAMLWPWARNWVLRLWSFITGRFHSIAPIPHDVEQAIEVTRSLEYRGIPGEWERKDHPNWPDARFKIPSNVKPWQIYYIRKGTLVATGSTARIERLPTGEVVKTPLENPLNEDAERLNRECMQCEEAVYRLLGNTTSAPKILAWDPDSCSLTLEYQENGNLEDYIEHHHDNITAATRAKWALQAAKVLAELHAKRIVHVDIAPRNFLLDKHLDLKICDFAGSSFPGRPVPPNIPGTRYQAHLWDRNYRPTEADDIFGLGSVLYLIMTGQEVYTELEEEEIRERFCTGNFPSVGHLQSGSIIEGCWKTRLKTAEAIADALEIESRLS